MSIFRHNAFRHTLCALLLLIAGSSLATDAVLKNEYGKKLSIALEFIDLPDILNMIANSPKRTPWQLYDEPGKSPLIERWIKASALPKTITSILDVGRIMSDAPDFNYRENPIMAGGDIMVDGKGYYRITEHQRDVLLTNPFLKVEYIKDPWQPTPEETTYLARHQYPSAGNYDHVKQFLSPELIADLDKAAPALQDPSDPVYKKLNQRIVGELADRAMKLDQSPISRYQMMISVHPFSDYNGRSTRMLYKIQKGHALFLPNFDLDLFLTHDEYLQAETDGEHFLDSIRQSFARIEQEHPSFPDYFDSLELWETFDHDQVVAGHEQDYVNRMIARFHQPDIQSLIRHKQYYDLSLRLHHDATEPGNPIADCLVREVVRH